MKTARRIASSGPGSTSLTAPPVAPRQGRSFQTCRRTFSWPGGVQLQAGQQKARGPPLYQEAEEGEGDVEAAVGSGQ